MTTVSLLLSGEMFLRGPVPRTFSVALLAPLSGVMGIVGPAIINCALLAAEEVSARSNAAVELVLVDAGATPAAVAREVDLLVGAGLIAGLVGTHTSNIRTAVGSRVADRVPYIFTPPHEFSGARSGSIFLGSNPNGQLRQPMAWLARNRKITRWALIGSDYVWPRQVHAAASRMLHDLGHRVVLNRLVPLGHVDVEELVEAARRGGADAILVSLVGRDGIVFHRGITELDVGDAFVRLSTALDENCLVAAGGDNSGELYSVMPSFIRQDDDRHQRLLESYVARFGHTAPLPGSYAEGSYDGVHLLAALCGGAGGGARPFFEKAERLLSDGAAPVPPPMIHGQGLQRQPMRLARAVGTDFDVVGTFAQV
ncbi:MAG: ABC transporter substrate-binding protein [Cryobacterium sp.]|uniref:ABC transporter substrate-binding protein n=1 Tax=unclassified Cryobacterium TaxID=2649013 RepID=UPI0022A43C65|nr:MULTISPECIES: ABC transporter substrate-binding protein [unclassified Cryobacterium]MCY7403573.1 ABC transporter substrate-binding protein [Cryobacterium sp.]